MTVVEEGSLNSRPELEKDSWKALAPSSRRSDATVWLALKAPSTCQLAQRSAKEREYE